MVLFFKDKNELIYAVDSPKDLDSKSISKLEWLFVGKYIDSNQISSKKFLGPKKTMITPWSTNAVEIAQNMAINGLLRIEVFKPFCESLKSFDPMLFELYDGLNQDIFKNNILPNPLLEIDDINHYNEKEGLALSIEEINYLKNLSIKINRKLTDSEVFGFSQVNSEHCRHKIFNGKFIIDGKEKEDSLFKLIKKTSLINPNEIVSAYKDNVAFVKGPNIEQFAPSKSRYPFILRKNNF